MIKLSEREIAGILLVISIILFVLLNSVNE